MVLLDEQHPFPHHLATVTSISWEEIAHREALWFRQVSAHLSSRGAKWPKHKLARPLNSDGPKDDMFWTNEYQVQDFCSKPWNKRSSLCHRVFLFQEWVLNSPKRWGCNVDKIANGVTIWGIWVCPGLPGLAFISHHQKTLLQSP